MKAEQFNQDTQAEYNRLTPKDNFLEVTKPYDIEAGMEVEELGEAGIATFNKHYNLILNHEDATVGEGNNAIVLKEHPVELKDQKNIRCIKCSWETLTVGNSKKNGGLIPKNFEPLKRAEKKFAEINIGIKERLARGMLLISENGAIKEAAIQQYAHEYLKKHGRPSQVPSVIEIKSITRNIDRYNDTENLYVNERAHFIYMEQIRGKTIQEIIEKQDQSIIKNIDLSEFERELTAVIKMLHKAGIAHRDLSIRNIMLDNTDLHPWVIDFGKAAFSDNLSEDDINKDLQFVREAVNEIRKLISDPVQALKDLRKRQDESKTSKYLRD